MTVGRHCRRPAATADPSITLMEAARRMAEERVGSLVLADEGMPSGMLTDRDVVMQVLGEGHKAVATPARDVTAGQTVVLAEDLPLHEASATMRLHGLRRVPVVDSEGRVQGVLAADDLVGLLARELMALADVAAEQVPPGVRTDHSGAGPARDVELYASRAATISPQGSLGDAARMMAAQGIGCLLVVDDEQQLTGIVTDRDLAVRAVAKGLPADAPVARVSSASVVSVDVSASLQDAAAAMSEAGVRRLAVTRGRLLAGLLSWDDLLIALGDELHDLGSAARRRRERERRL